MNNLYKNIKSGAPLFAAMVALLTFSGHSYGQVNVSPGDMGIWTLSTADDSGASPGGSGASATMVTGPSYPLLGTGSAELSLAAGSGGNAAMISTDFYDGTLVSNLTRLSYATFVTTNNGQQFPYLQLSVSTTGTGPADDILFFEPPYQTPTTGNASLPNQGATVLGTWQVWDAAVGGWWSDDGNAGLDPGTGVGSLSDFLVAFPNATIATNPFSGGGIAITVGYGSDSDSFNGYVDDVTVGTTSGTTVYNFEGGAAAPEPSTWALLFAGLGLLAFGRKLVRRA